MNRRFARDSDLTDNQTGKVDVSYMAEVEAMTSRRERLYWRRERALVALARAEEQVALAKQQRAGRAAVRAAWHVVEERRAELRRLERLMTANPGASSSHRGTESVWPTHAENAVAREADRDSTRVSDGRRHPVATTQRSASCPS